MVIDAILMILALACGCLLASRRLFHWFQLESYQFRGYFHTLRRNWYHAVLPGCCMTAASALLLLADSLLGQILYLRGAVWLAVLCGTGWVICRAMARQPAKKKFVLTARVKRLYAAALILYLGISAACILPPWKGGAALWPLLLPFWAALAGLLAYPVEKLIQFLYLQDAGNKLKAHDHLLKIGITGSYGKTSVKFILNELLQDKYQVLVTPASFNTPMGLTKVIRTKLQPAHQIFLAEMGARHRRDIRDLCRLVHPDLGILTAVGPQHLDTFGSIEQIRETKFDLIRALPENGCAFFPNDDAICRELWEGYSGNKRMASVRKVPGADVWAENIKVTPRGSEFLLCTDQGSVPCRTKLLGSFNIQNILLAASAAIYLGVSLKQIAHGVERLEPVEHRLQLIDNPGGITIIDDAFNSNPVSSEQALRVLKDFSGRRIVITPGMVELGGEEAAFNRRFGAVIAECADVAILVGKRHTKPIQDGLLEKHFPQDSLYVASDLNEATELLRSIGRPGDTVLFENDLPDHYTET